MGLYFFNLSRDGASVFSSRRSVMISSAPCSARKIASPRPRPRRPSPISVTRLLLKKSFQSFIISSPENRLVLFQRYTHRDCHAYLHRRHAPFLFLHLGKELSLKLGE